MNGARFEIVVDDISNVESSISEKELLIVESKRHINKSYATGEGFRPLEEIVYIKTVAKTALNEQTN